MSASRGLRRRCTRRGRPLRQADLTAHLMAALGTNAIDVVVLNRAPILLYHRVLRDAACSPATCGQRRFARCRALSRYFDFLPQMEKMDAADGLKPAEDGDPGSGRPAGGGPASRGAAAGARGLDAGTRAFRRSRSAPTPTGDGRSSAAFNCARRTRSTFELSQRRRRVRPDELRLVHRLPRRGQGAAGAVRRRFRGVAGKQRPRARLSRRRPRADRRNTDRFARRLRGVRRPRRAVARGDRRAADRRPAVARRPNRAGAGDRRSTSMSGGLVLRCAGAGRNHSGAESCGPQGAGARRERAFR